MLNVIISYWNAILFNTGLFEVNFDLAEPVVDGEKMFHAIYDSDNGYSFDNQDFSSYNGLSYWTLRRSIGNSVEPDPNRAGKWVNRVKYPLSLVFVIPRDLVPQDCSTTSVDTMQTIASQFTRQTKELRKLLGAKEVYYGGQEWVTDRKQILSTQYSGTGPVDVDYKYHYFQLDLDLTIVIPSECIDSICDIESFDVINLFKWCDPSTYFRLTPENQQCIQDNFCSGGGAGSVNVNQSDGTLIQNVSGGTPATEYNVSDSIIQSSGGAFNDSVKATDSYAIPDNSYLDCEGDPQTQEYGTIIDCQVGLNRVYRPPLPSGQYTSFRVGDEGTQVQSGTYDYNATGRLVDLEKSNSSFFVTLTENNIYGNPLRFTNDIGTQDTDGTGGSTPDYIIDHYTGLGWYINLNTPTNWNAQIDAALLIVTGGPAFYTDFRMPNKPEGESIADSSISLTVFNYTPFSLNLPSGVWTSTTFITSPVRAYNLSQNGDTGLPMKASSNGNLIAVRNHFV